MITLCIVTFLVLTNKYIIANEVRFLLGNNDEALNFTELAKANGYIAEEYEVVTEDGYILGLFRIRGKRAVPVLLMHGLTDTSDTWLLRANGSLGITLASKDYDVWFGNIRGNKYSRRHVSLNPDKDAAFWDFSFHEYGYYDLAVIIDTVLNKTRARKIFAIGHSQGTTIFYVLGSTRTEYNDKIQIMTSLAPICFLNHIPPPLSLVINVAPEINAFAKAIGANELFGKTPSGKIIDYICQKGIISYPICTFGYIFPFSGYDIMEFGPEFYNLALKHFPDSTSRKNLYHFAQVSRRHNFTRYDYGPFKNFKEYKSIRSPHYDLKKVTMPIVLLSGRNDRVSLIPDVDILNAELPNVLKYKIIDRKLMSHLDFIWGEHMEDYLFPLIFNVLESVCGHC